MRAEWSRVTDSLLLTQVYLNGEVDLGEDNGAKTRSDAERLFEYDYAIGTDIGMRRTENQDAYGYTRSPVTDLFVLADGMGGNRGGATASSIAVNLINRVSFGEEELVTEESLRSAILQTNLCILQAGKREEELSGMGTTIAILVLHDEEAFVAHIGDSRIYMLRSEQLYQITRDHTLVQELVDSGALTPEQAANHPIGHMLTRAVGQTEKVEVDVGVISGGVVDGDRFLLCSDGLYNHVDNHEIHAALQGMTPGDAVEHLLDLANERGGSDNITIMIVSIRGVQSAGDLQGREGFYLNLCTKVGLRYCAGLAEASGFIDPDRIDYRSDLPEKRELPSLQNRSRLIEPGESERPLVSSVYAPNLEDAEKYNQTIAVEPLQDVADLSLVDELDDESVAVEVASAAENTEQVGADLEGREGVSVAGEEPHLHSGNLSVDEESTTEEDLDGLDGAYDTLLDVTVQGDAEPSESSVDINEPALGDPEALGESVEEIDIEDISGEEHTQVDGILEDKDSVMPRVDFVIQPSPESPQQEAVAYNTEATSASLVAVKPPEPSLVSLSDNVSPSATPLLSPVEAFRAKVMPEESLFALFTDAKTNSDSAIGQSAPAVEEAIVNEHATAVFPTLSGSDVQPRTAGDIEAKNSNVTGGDTGEYVEVTQVVQGESSDDASECKVEITPAVEKAGEQNFPLVKSRARSSLVKLSTENGDVQQVTQVISPVSGRSASVVTAVQASDDTVAFRKRSFYLGLSIMAALLSLAGYVLSRSNSRFELAMIGVKTARQEVSNGGKAPLKVTMPRHEMKPVERPGDRIVPVGDPDKPLAQEDVARTRKDEGVGVEGSGKGEDSEVAPLINAPADEVSADVFREPEYLSQTLVERLKARYGYGERQWMELISYNPGRDALDKLSPADVQSKLMLEDRLAGVSQALVIGRIVESSEVAEMRMEVKDLIAAQNVALEESLQKLRKAKETVRRYKGDLGAIAPSRLLALAEELAVDHEDVDAELDYYRETQVLLAKAIDRYTEQPADLQLSKDYSRLLSRTRERQDSLQALVEDVVRRSYQQAVLEVASWGLLRWDSERRIARYRQELESLERWTPVDASSRLTRIRKLESELNDLSAQLYQASVTVPDYLEVAFRREIIVKDEGVEP
ncbi:MAG: Stp1/IreP family PP2C-type Ser/Thr phosphatase [bacterium]|nr:Stp1/IreP family PP2C-type Ser/Thr phosphatase [bacterium]